MKAVHFGAGNIGRGFIGLMLSKAGYEVCFIDVNQEVVAALQARGEYPVEVASKSGESFTVRGVSAINSATDPAAAARAVAGADLVTTAVGVDILKHIAGTIAEGLSMRLKAGGSKLHVIACENAIGGSTRLKGLVYDQIEKDTRLLVEQCVAFPDAAVDRIVPLQQHEDPLKVVVEPFYEWAVDRSQMFDDYVPVEGVNYVEHLEPYIERKLFTVNTGHCSAAYMGFLKGFDTIQEAINDSDVAEHVAAVLEETGALLVSKHGFDWKEHQEYIQTILGRLRNPSLADEVSRVGRSPIRKISPGERLVLPAVQACELNLSYTALAKSIATALLFNEPGDPESIELLRSVRESGVLETAIKYTGFPAAHPAMNEIMQQYNALQLLLR